jgi:hypothetical protein
MDIVRTSGTFSYISGYAAFLSFIALLAIGYNMGQNWRIKGNIIPLVALVLAIGAMFTTGSRSPVYGLMVATPIILWLSVQSGVLSARIALRLCILVPIIVFVALNVSPRATEAFMGRASEADSSYALMRAFPMSEKIFALANAPIIGMGIGTTQGGAITIMGTDSYWWLQDLLVEDEMARITVELGVVGLVFMFTVRILIVVFAFRCVRSFSDPGHRALAIALLAYLSLAFVFPIVINVTANLYYWGAFGLLLVMQRLEGVQRLPLKGVETRLHKSFSGQRLRPVGR